MLKIYAVNKSTSHVRIVFPISAIENQRNVPQPKRIIMQSSTIKNACYLWSVLDSEIGSILPIFISEHDLTYGQLGYFEYEGKYK